LITVALAGFVPRPEPATVVVPNPTAPGKTGRAELCAKADPAVVTAMIPHATTKESLRILFKEKLLSLFELLKCVGEKPFVSLLIPP